MSKLTFFEWLNMWLQTYKRFTVKPSTFGRYENCIAKFCDADFPLSDVSLYYLQGKVNQLHMEGLSRSSIKQCIVCAREAIRKAVIVGELPAGHASFCDLLELPHNPPKKVGAFTPFEVRRLLSELDKLEPNYCDNLIKFLFLTGLRVGEALALTADSIDWEHHNAVIRLTDYRGDLQEPKTEHSVRVIPLSSEAMAILADRASCSEWLFCDENGQRFRYHRVLRRFHKLLDVCGYERRGLHSLRHTYASHALRCGVSPVVLARLLGHVDSSFTLRQYCEADFSDLRDAARVFSYRKEGIGNG